MRNNFIFTKIISDATSGGITRPAYDELGNFRVESLKDLTRIADVSAVYLHEIRQDNAGQVFVVRREEYGKGVPALATDWRIVPPDDAMALVLKPENQGRVIIGIKDGRANYKFRFGRKVISVDFEDNSATHSFERLNNIYDKLQNLQRIELDKWLSDLVSSTIDLQKSKAMSRTDSQGVLDVLDGFMASAKEYLDIDAAVICLRAQDESQRNVAKDFLGTFKYTLNEATDEFTREVVGGDPGVEGLVPKNAFQDKGLNFQTERADGHHYYLSEISDVNGILGAIYLHSNSPYNFVENRQGQCVEAAGLAYQGPKLIKTQLTDTFIRSLREEFSRVLITYVLGSIVRAELEKKLQEDRQELALVRTLKKLKDNCKLNPETSIGHNIRRMLHAIASSMLHLYRLEGKMLFYIEDNKLFDIINKEINKDKEFAKRMNLISAPISGAEGGHYRSISFTYNLLPYSLVLYLPKSQKRALPPALDDMAIDAFKANLNFLVETVYSNYDLRTGVLNLNCFNSLAEKYLRQSQYGYGATSIFFFDIDKFKTWNHAVGHIGADIMLAIVGQNMKDYRAKYFREHTELFGKIQIREGRYGGDEFIKVILGLSQNEAQEYGIGFFRYLTTHPFELIMTLDDRIKTVGTDNTVYVDFLRFCMGLLNPSVGEKDRGKNATIGEHAENDQGSSLSCIYMSVIKSNKDTAELASIMSLVGKDAETLSPESKEFSDILNKQMIADDQRSGSIRERIRSYIIKELDNKIRGNRLFPSGHEVFDKAFKLLIEQKLLNPGINEDELRSYIRDQLGVSMIVHKANISTSMGMVSSDEKDMSITDLSSFEEKADDRQTRAKELGRNCFVGVDNLLIEIPKQ